MGSRERPDGSSKYEQAAQVVGSVDSFNELLVRVSIAPLFTQG